MKRILFVDDEPRVLQGLQRMLRQDSRRWETVFVGSGPEALDKLAAQPFDVIVSDMRMPGMDGATLLGHVRERHPGVVRLVLSGHFEVQAALRATPVAHQFMAKPCSPEALRAALERACNLSDLLVNEELRQAIGAIGELPSPPRTCMLLLQELANPEASFSRVAGIVEQDVGLASKVLQLVNSAFFGFTYEFATVQRAVNYLGIDVLRQLVTSVEILRTFRTDAACGIFSLEDLDAHSRFAAGIAGQLPVSGDVAVPVLAALLHDVGQLVLAMRLPEQFALALETACETGRSLHSVERELNGVTHAEAGGFLLGLWGLPRAVVDAVTHHHRPLGRPEAPGVLSPTAAVQVADALAHEYCPEIRRASHPAFPALDLQYLEELGLASRLPAWREKAEQLASRRSVDSETRP
ncbi:MAG: HDOD domain-containing protein [Bryobacteraceae bacterium]